MDPNTLTVVNIAVAFLIAVLSGLGVGSGGLLVAYLVSSSQAIATEARAVNLLFFIISAGIAFLFNIKSRKLLPKMIFLLSSVGIVGCLLGAWFAGTVSADTTRKAFGILLVVSGVYSLLGDSLVQKIKAFLLGRSTAKKANKR